MGDGDKRPLRQATHSREKDEESSGAQNAKMKAESSIRLSSNALTASGDVAPL